MIKLIITNPYFNISKKIDCTDYTVEEFIRTTKVYSSHFTITLLRENF